MSSVVDAKARFGRRQQGVAAGQESSETSTEHATLELGVEGFNYSDLQKPERLEALFDVFDRRFKAEDSVVWARWRRYLDGVEAPSAVEVSRVITEAAPFVSRFLLQLFGVQHAGAALKDKVSFEQSLFEFRRLFVRPRFYLRRDNSQSDSGALASLGETLLAELPSELAEPARTLAEDTEARFAAVALELLAAQRELKLRSGGAPDALAETPLLSPVVNKVLTLVTAWLDAQPDAAMSEAVRRHLAEGADVNSGHSKLSLLALALDALEVVLRALQARGVCATWLTFYEPEKVNDGTLVPLERVALGKITALEGLASHRRERDEPFALTDTRGTLREAAKEVDYCVLCQTRGKDSCSKGLRDKQGAIKRNALGVELNGCPLDEKIGEMHALRKVGDVVAALATAAIDNPMLAGTGHRICNDCMKGCIFQQQEPVNIPKIETRVLSDVLALPWGVEIYQLLTRWNPLNRHRPYPLPFNGKKVLVVGLGPAGYTLCHYLLNEGFAVVAIDGLKLEPLPAAWTGPDCAPIREFSTLQEPLETRINYGFGGVSEYGITVRWDKNFLLLTYLTLARRGHFQAFGGIRFGGTLTLDDAWSLGFDHVAIAAGAGRPQRVPMKHELLRGVRAASDFLMGLQLTGAYKREALANVQVRLPALVVGGGLTAVDTATELLAYYVVEAERAAKRYRALEAAYGPDVLGKVFDEEERAIVEELVGHGEALLAERADAAATGRKPELQKLLQAWGGVTLVYRKSLSQAPAYRLNHEEVAKAMEEGVRFVESLTPVEAHADGYGALEAVSFERTDSPLGHEAERVRLPAKTMCIAAGTKPNVGYEDEFPGTFELDERGYFSSYRVLEATSSGVHGQSDKHLVPAEDGSGFLTSYRGPAGQCVSFYGDNHPTYAGSVVKAMASAKHGYKAVASLLEDCRPASEVSLEVFQSSVAEALTARVHRVTRLADDIVEVVIHAPLAARKFEPGQFYRLQNFESFAPSLGGMRLTMEGLALTGASVDHDKGLLSTIALEMGSSSRMCSLLEEGEPVVLMGPTGAPTVIPAGEKVLLAGGGLGNAVLFSIARAIRERGSEVIYFAGYKRGEGLFKQDEVEAATDQVIWSTDAGAEITPRRPQDRHFRGNIVEAMLAYARGELGPVRISLGDVDRIIAIGSDRMMMAVKNARGGVLAPYLKPSHRAIGSINSPMQCMMKAICAQCLQRVTDPNTGASTLVYICAEQDQELDSVDFGHLAARLRQNSALEKLSDLWFSHQVRTHAINSARMVDARRLSLRPVGA